MRRDFKKLILTTGLSVMMFASSVSATEIDKPEIQEAGIQSSDISVSQEADLSLANRLTDVDVEDFASASNALTTNSTEDTGIIAGTVSDYLGATEAYVYYQLPLSAGQYFQAQLTVPNNVDIDYDLYLMDSNGDIVAGGDSITYINGTSGTVPETLGYVTESDETYYIYVLSSNGGSETVPYTLDYSISTSYDYMEPDESYKDRWIIGDLPSNGYSISSRNLSSPVDNDWYEFTISSDSRLVITASTASVNTCKVELYRNISTDWYRLKKISLDSADAIPAGTYCLRVSNALSMEDFDDTDIQNYSLGIMPARSASSITIEKMVGTEGEKYVTYSAGGRLFRTGVGTVTISGTAYDEDSQPAAYVPVSVTYTNPNWNVYDWKTVSESGFTDGSGKYSISLVIPKAYGAYHEYVTVSTHYFDICRMKAEVIDHPSVYDEKSFYLSSHVVFN